MRIHSPTVLAPFLFLAVCFAGCQPLSPLAEPAVVLSFDDAFVEGWHEHRWLFDEYDARVTSW